MTGMCTFGAFSMNRLIQYVGALAVAVSAAGQTRILTLDDCIRMAQSAQSAVSIARRETEIARYGVKQARAGFLPQAGLTNGYVYNTPRGDTQAFVALNGAREYVSLFGAALQLDTSGRLRAEMARARADQDFTQTNLLVAQRDLRRAVTAAYYRLLLTRRLAGVARSALEEAQSFEKRTRLLAQGGEAAQADVVKAAAEAAFLDQALSAAELDAKIANYELASFWTTAVDQELTVDDVLARKPLEPEASAQPGAPFMRRPEFNLLDAQKRGFLADARRERANLLPQASLVFQYGLDANHMRWNERGTAAFVNLNIPLFDWFRTLSASKQFRLRAENVDTAAGITRRNFSKEYESALARVRIIYQQIAQTETQVKFSGDNLRLSRVRYDGGEGSALEVVTAQTQLAQARANYYTAIANYFNARADLEVAAAR